MNYKYYIADVFTNQVFNGAQVAVFPVADGLSDQMMLKISREIHLTETVFLFKQHDSENSWQMRVFSPTAEIDYTGHPVIAAAYVLASSGELGLTEKNTTLVLEQNTGPVFVSVSGANGKPNFIQYTRQVSPVVDYYAPTDGEIANILNISETDIDNKKYCTRLVSCGFPYLIVPVFYYETVRKARFNFSVWTQSTAPQTAAQEILVVSPRTPNKDSEFAVRLLGPNIGVHQDPPVGSTMASFAAYLCSFDFMREGTYTYAVERGDEKVRRSVLNLEMDHKGEDKLTIRVGGEAVVVADATMYIPE
ncbi:MAG: PhzF family phenazine biosynthesis protein [Methylococcaceae bacterium]|nr:PhzF family phenazine biosynthesis protein [Methylococcaceae bacterium]